MKTIETTAVIGEDRILQIQLPPEVTPGRHQIAVIIDEPAEPASKGLVDQQIPIDGVRWYLVS